MASIAQARTRGAGRYGFRHAARMEWIKLRSLRSTTWVLAAGVAITIALGAVAGFNTRNPHGDPTSNILAGIAFGQVVFGVLGVLTMTGEYSSGMIGATLAAIPRLPLVLAAKAATYGLVALAAGEITTFGSFLGGTAVLRAPVPQSALSQPTVLRAVAMTGAYLALADGPRPRRDHPAQRRRGRHADRRPGRAAAPGRGHAQGRAVPAGADRANSLSAVKPIGSYTLSPWIELGIVAAYAAALLGAGCWSLVRRDALHRTTGPAQARAQPASRMPEQPPNLLPRRPALTAPPRYSTKDKPMSYPQPDYRAACGQATSRQALRRLSPSLAVLAAAAFAGGVAAGYIAYLHRSPALHKHLPGTAAWPQQLVVAALAGAVFGYAYWRHHRTPGRRGEPPWLLSPIGKPAARRLARTIRGGLSGPSASGRAVLALALAGLFLYGLYRAGRPGYRGAGRIRRWQPPVSRGVAAAGLWVGCSPVRVFIAGASGVIGVRLIPLLAADGHVVAGMTRFSGKAACCASSARCPWSAMCSTLTPSPRR